MTIVKQKYHGYHDYCLNYSISIVKTVYKHVKLSINISNTPKLVMVSASYHDITRLLLLMIIVISKNYTILIIGKGNITVNRQNRLIAHPYYTGRLVLV